MVEDTITDCKKKLDRVGTIGRFKPLHNGGFLVLEALCSKAEHVVIGIGSSNKYNMRNPFTAVETEDMLRFALAGKDNYTIVPIPDFAHMPDYEDGKKWKEETIKLFGHLDYFFTTNDFVGDLLRDTYKIIPSYTMVVEEKRIPLRATEVRVVMARGDDWKKLVPESVADYIVKNKLDERFRKEFGLRTLASLVSDYTMKESADEEKRHAQEA